MEQQNADFASVNAAKNPFAPPIFKGSKIKASDPYISKAGSRYTNVNDPLIEESHSNPS